MKATKKAKKVVPVRAKTRPPMASSREYVYEADDGLDSHAVRGTFDGGWQPYVSVAERQAAHQRATKKLKAKGQTLTPLLIERNKLAHTFWGKAWCRHVEVHCDYESRLSRGRSYLRSGAVIDLKIAGGQVLAQVQGSSLYQVKIGLAPLSVERRLRLIELCTREIPDALSLLKGELSDTVSKLLTDKDQGLFPNPGELSLSCSCPDWARLCKHGAAVLYGIGYRFDIDPLSLFALRGILPQELLSKAGELASSDHSTAIGSLEELSIDGQSLEDIFGVTFDLEVGGSKKNRS